MNAFKNSKGEWDWFKIVVPVLTIIILPLIALVYNNMAEAIEKKCDKGTTEVYIAEIKEDVKQKVDNETLKQMILLQNQQQKFLQEQVKEQKQVDKETLKTLQNLNIQMMLIEQQLKKE